MSGNAVPSDEFNALIQPECQVLLNLVDAGQTLRGSRHLPDGNSLGMRELEEEVELRGDWSAEPVRTAHLASNLFFFVAEDAARGLAHSFDGSWTPVFAHVTLARSALEACARARWILEPEIGARRRVGRALANEMHDFAERLCFPEEADPARAEDLARHRRRIEGARARGLLTEQRPGYTVVIDRLFEEESAGDEQLGALMARWWAGIAHGGFHALRRSLDASAAEVDAVTGTPTVPIITRDDDVKAVIGILSLAYITALEAQLGLFGWWEDALTDAVAAALQVARDRFSA